MAHSEEIVSGVRGLVHLHPQQIDPCLRHIIRGSTTSRFTMRIGP